jgi:hypothetical protein
VEGSRFSRLLVIKEASGSVPRRRKWTCKCDCGNTKDVRQDHLTSGATTSCGCAQKEAARKARFKGNEWSIVGNIAYAHASNVDKIFGVDKEDLPRVKDYTWSVNSKGYLEANVKGRTTSLHRFILVVTDEKNVVDHINRDPRDNRKENLRIVTSQQNSWNRIEQINNQSGHRGVSWRPEKNKWLSRIQNSHIGYYDTYEKAVDARLKEEKKRFGKYAPEVD